MQNIVKIYPLGSEAKQVKVKDLKSNLRGQQYIFKKFCTSSKTITITSFTASYYLAKKGKSFSDEELMR